MSLAIRERILRLEYCDRLLLLLAVGWILVGIPGNYLRVHRMANPGSWSVAAILLWTAIAGVMVYSVVRRKRRVAAYGFSFQRGGLVSLAILAIFHLYLVISGKFVLAATGNLVLSTWGALMEELIFRSATIDQLMVLLDGIRRRKFWAILASSVLWSVLHIPSKSPSQLLGGIFLGGLVFGYIYYKSRSILLPAWTHSVANAGYLGGVLIAILYCAVTAADYVIGSRNREASRVAVASTGN